MIHSQSSNEYSEIVDQELFEKRKRVQSIKEAKKPESVQCQQVSMANLVVRRQKELESGHSNESKAKA